MKAKRLTEYATEAAALLIGGVVCAAYVICIDLIVSVAQGR